jgi:branched-chain amino acid transport system substrate-binding protein
MPSRRTFISIAMAVGGIPLTRRFASAEQRSAARTGTPGVTDTEIRIGQTMPYSGPVSAYGVIGRTQLAYFRIINDQGGINGRRINLISLDNGYSPRKPSS